jgi:hypothetical protein
MDSDEIDQTIDAESGINQHNVGRIAERIVSNELEFRGFRVSDLNKEGTSANADLLAARIGKTTTLSVIRSAAESQGYQVEGFAPTSRAARQLGEAGVPAGTLQGFLARSASTVPPDQRHLYFVDESSLASTNQMREFLSRLTPKDRSLFRVIEVPGLVVCGIDWWREFRRTTRFVQDVLRLFSSLILISSRTVLASSRIGRRRIFLIFSFADEISMSTRDGVLTTEVV